MIVRADTLKLGDIVQTIPVGSIGIVASASTHVHGVRIILLCDSDHGPTLKGETIDLGGHAMVSLLDADFYNEDGTCVHRTYSNQEVISHEPLVAKESSPTDFNQPNEVVMRCLHPGCTRDARKHSNYCQECWDKMHAYCGDCHINRPAPSSRFCKTCGEKARNAYG